MDIESIISDYNNTPDERLSGLTPVETNELIYNAFGESSPVKIKEKISDEILDKIPFLRITEELLKIIEREKFIKLTPLGALPKKVVVELYNHKQIPEFIIESGMYKLSKEADTISILTCRIVCELSGIVKKKLGKLTLTKKGENYLKNENRLELFKTIFKSFTSKFNWGYHDLFPQEPVAQYGSLFSIYLLLQFGNNELPSDFYSERYLRVFSKFISLFEESDFRSAFKQFNHCYQVRTFERFTDWFGFTISEEKTKLVEERNVLSPKHLSEIFEFKRLAYS